MAKCSFCKREIEKGTGMMVAQPDGKVFRFDSRRCEKSMLVMGRDARRIKWVRKMKEGR